MSLGVCSYNLFLYSFVSQSNLSSWWLLSLMLNCNYIFDGNNSDSTVTLWFLIHLMYIFSVQMHFSKDMYILPGCADTEKKIEKNNKKKVFGIVFYRKFLKNNYLKLIL